MVYTLDTIICSYLGVCSTLYIKPHVLKTSRAYSLVRAARYSAVTLSRETCAPTLLVRTDNYHKSADGFQLKSAQTCFLSYITYRDLRALVIFHTLFGCQPLRAINALTLFVCAVL